MTKSKADAAKGKNPGGRKKGQLGKRTIIFRELMGKEGLLAEGLVKLIVDVIQKGELPGRVHPFYANLNFLNKKIQKRKTNKAPTAEEWEQVMDHAERLLIGDVVSTDHRLGLIKDVIGYIFPRLKAVEHSMQTAGAQQYGVLLIANPVDRDKWSELAQAQQQEAIEEAAAEAKDVSSE